MGANEKHAAAYHGAEYTPTPDEVREQWAYTESPRKTTIAEAVAEFDRMLAKVRAEAGSDALTKIADALEAQLAGITSETGQTRAGRDIIRWLREHAAKAKGGENDATK